MTQNMSAEALSTKFTGVTAIKHIGPTCRRDDDDMTYTFGWEEVQHLNFKMIMLN